MGNKGGPRQTGGLEKRGGYQGSTDPGRPSGLMQPQTNLIAQPQLQVPANAASPAHGTPGSAIPQAQNDSN
jgi:hypothetical protein